MAVRTMKSILEVAGLWCWAGCVSRARCRERQVVKCSIRCLQTPVPAVTDLACRQRSCPGSAEAIPVRTWHWNVLATLGRKLLLRWDAHSQRHMSHHKAPGSSLNP